MGTHAGLQEHMIYLLQGYQALYVLTLALRLCRQHESVVMSSNSDTAAEASSSNSRNEGLSSHPSAQVKPLCRLVYDYLMLWSQCMHALCHLAHISFCCALHCELPTILAYMYLYAMLSYLQSISWGCRHGLQAASRASAADGADASLGVTSRLGHSRR